MKPPTTEQVIELVRRYGLCCANHDGNEPKIARAIGEIENAVTLLAGPMADKPLEAVAVTWRNRTGSAMSHLCPDDRSWTMCARYLGISRAARAGEPKCRSCSRWLAKHRGG